MKGEQLEKFAEEVLCKGAEAVLPQNLSDHWFQLLLEEVEIFEKGFDDIDNPEESFPGLLAAVVVIINQNKGDLLRKNKKLEISSKKLFDCLEYYTRHLSLEEINRKTDVEVEPPTLKNIFNPNRNIKFKRRLD